MNLLTINLDEIQRQKKKNESKKKYPLEQKNKALELSNRLTIAKLVEATGIPRGTLTGWIREYKKGAY